MNSVAAVARHASASTTAAESLMACIGIDDEWMAKLVLDSKCVGGRTGERVWWSLTEDVEDEL